VKKCASCSKDLPDAALHCVFCGAKQPPAPATSGGMAKTVMGSYSANDVMEQLRNQQQPGGPARPAPGPTPGAPYNPPAAPSPFQRPGGPPGPAAMPTMAAGPGPGPMHPAHGPTHVGGPAGAPPQPQGVPIAPAEARTMFVPGPGPAPAGGFPGPGGPGPGGHGPGGHGPGGHGYGGPSPMPYSPPGGGMGPGPGPNFPPMQPQPAPYAPPRPQQQPMPMPMPMPMPSGMPPYLAAQASARSSRPIEPWKDSLRLMMFIWGGALLVVFATPLTVENFTFHWDAIVDGKGMEKLTPLVMASIGLLSIVLALIPTSPAPRGLLAGLLGLAGIALPFVLDKVTDWKAYLPLAATLFLIPGLLIREEYRESILPRIMVTIGVLALLVPMLLPQNSQLPLVDLFKQVIDAPGKAKVAPLLQLGYIVVIVLSLLAWLPAPASGGAKVFAWLLLLWPGVVLLTMLIVNDLIADAVTKAPNTVIIWAVATAYSVLVGYGFATVIGKKLE
jgi:hypothetical protein